MQKLLKNSVMLMLKVGAFVLVIYSLTGMGCGKGFLIVGGKPAIVSSVGFERVVKVIPGADAKTFKSLNNSAEALVTYASDANRVYIGYFGNAMQIEQSDPTTFAILSTDGEYTADCKRVYWCGVEIKGADPATFRIVKSPFAIDANKAFVGLDAFAVYSLENFKVLRTYESDWPIGNENGRLIAKGHEKFTTSGWSSDGVAYYWGSIELMEVDYDSLVILNEIYAKDNATVYFKGKAMSGADANSFRIVGPGVIRGRDKKHDYKLGRRVKRPRKPKP